MIPVPQQTAANGAVRVWLATGHTDMRKGFSSLAMGPNGPIPAIVVHQFGYPPVSRKVAGIRGPETGYVSVRPGPPCCRGREA